MRTKGAGARRYPETGRSAYHLFIFTYDPDPFDGLPKAHFLEALNAEGVVASQGYRPLTDLPFLYSQEQQTKGG